jgi:uncharacterized protein (TIGR00106 family)
MSLLVDFSMFPLDKGESVSPYVARLVRVIRESGLPHKLGPMGTSIEGEWEEVMAVVGRCFEALRTDCHRIVMTLKVDYRKEGSKRLTQKIRSVQEHLDR